MAFEIWNIYLTKFIDRYGAKKLDRARDLFEQALTKCPAKYLKPLFLLYGKMEEEYGLGRHSLRIYDRATRAVDSKDRLEMYKYYIAKAGSAFGLAATREIYEDAIARLPDAQAKDMSLAYADLETRLGEIDRARAIYAHASQLCDPRTVPTFWSSWHAFEVAHGNEDTFKEMLRIKRSVQAQFTTDMAFVSASLSAVAAESKEGGGSDRGEEGGVKGLSTTSRPAHPGLGSSDQREEGEAVPATTSKSTLEAGGAEAIEIDMGEDGESDEEEGEE